MCLACAVQSLLEKGALLQQHMRLTLARLGLSLTRLHACVSMSCWAALALH